MASTAAMSLDAIIRNRRGGGNFRERGRAQHGRGIFRTFTSGRMAGVARRGPLGVNSRPSSYTIAKSTRRTRSFPWQTDLFEDSIRAAGIQGVEIGTKLYISNLDYGVTNDDIKELFYEIGDVKRYAVHYDKTGRPSGSAEVVYIRRSDAFAALKRYNNVLLDGKPMKIEIIGTNSDVPVRVNVTGVNGRKKRTVFMASSQSGGRGSAHVNRGISKPRRGAMVNNRGRGAMVNNRGREAMVNNRGRGAMVNNRGRGAMVNNHGRGRGRGRGKQSAAVKSADDLDKDLDTYHAEAMNTS